MIPEVGSPQCSPSETSRFSPLDDREDLTKVSAEACDDATERSARLLPNILEHAINSLNIVAVLHRDLVPEDALLPFGRKHPNSDLPHRQMRVLRGGY